MNEDAQALFLNAIPLLALSALYLAATAALVPALRRERGRIRELDLALVLVYPSLAAAGAITAGAVLATRTPVAGNAWLGLAAIAVALVPALATLVRGRGRILVLPRTGRGRDGEAGGHGPGRRRSAATAFTGALTRADDPEVVARLLVEECVALLEVEFGSLTLVDGERGRGLYALLDGAESTWWRDVEFDLNEPSAVASAVFEAAPFAVFDIASSPAVNQEVARSVGARSGLWIPLVAGGRVIGVLALVATRERRAFTADEIALVQGIASEAGLALERARSGTALAEALERERLVGRIAQRVRAELDVSAVIETAVEETGTATHACRCFVRLGEAGGPMPVAAEWLADGFPTVGSRVEPLAPSDLAARDHRTVVIPDVEDARELADEHGGVEALLELGTRAVLATPIVVADRMIGVFALHRPEPSAWSEQEIVLTEAIAHELGLAIRIARLLEENRRRLGHQSALLQSAQVLTSELDFDGVIERLVEQVVTILDADAADCWTFDEAGHVLRCRAVHGLPAAEVGREIVPAGTLGEAIERGRPVLKRDFAATEQPPPTDPYRAFTEVMEAPIAAEGRVRGVLGVYARGSGRFNADDLDVLEAFAGLAALALRNAEAFAERARQARVQRGFYRIAAVLSEPLALEGTLDAAATAAAEALGGLCAAVLMPLEGRLELAAARDLPPPLADALGGGLPRTTTLLSAAAEGGRVIASVDVQADERFDEEWRATAAASDYRGLLAVPLVAPRGGSGLVLVFFAEQRRFSDDDLELADHVARVAAGALQRSGLYEEERSARSLAQQLARTGSLLATELDPAAVLEEVVQEAPRLVGVDACAIRVLEDDELVISAVAGADDEALIGSRSPGTAWLSGDVTQSRAPLAVADAGADERLLAVDPLLRLGHRAYLGVPLTGPEGALHGVLAVYSRAPRTWRNEEVEALLALAANASAALSNAELYQRVTLEKERSFAILSNIADGIVAVDREGRVVLWNSAAEQITGVPAAEALGRTPAQVLGQNLESDGALQGDRLVSILRGRDEVWLSLTEAIMRDPAGLVAGRIYAFRDISADRFVEQMKSDFVSTVSQELRRPLTSIYGFAETLLRRDVLFEEEERRTFLGYIASESERLTTIVDALLNVARLDSGDLQVNLAPTDVAAVVSEVVSALEPESGENRHEFVLELPDEPVSAEADRDKLGQVLSNLVDNAVKFSPEGGTVTVAVRRRRDTVEVSVADEGIGIAPAEHARIFRKFYRGDSAGGRSGGTGLGLFIVDGLVSAMGGRIWVASAEGEGASFTFELPLAREREAPALHDAQAGRV